MDGPLGQRLVKYSSNAEGLGEMLIPIINASLSFFTAAFETRLLDKPSFFLLPFFSP